MRAALLAILIPIAIVVGIVALALAFGGPGEPPPLSSINDPFKGVAHSDLPTVSRFTARDQTALAYRTYSPVGATTKGSVVPVHGSSANGATMHRMAKAFSAAGYAAYALDIRGHR
jgi:hypothetical protein